MVPVHDDAPAVELTWANGLVAAWHPRPSQASRPPGFATLALYLPSGRVAVPYRVMNSTDLDQIATAVEREGHDSPVRVSDSAAWFAMCHRYAEQIVRRGRLTPDLTPNDDIAGQRTGATWWRARWQPLESDLALVRRPFAAAMPPVVAAASPGQAPTELVDAVVGSLVDAIARQSLTAGQWFPELPDLRGTSSRAVRLVSRALLSQTGQFSVPPELVFAVEHLAEECEMMARRAAGEPVVRARLRLDTPADDATDDDDDDGSAELWPLALELVDVDDSARWCTWSEISDRHPAAVAIAASEPMVDLLDRIARQAFDAIEQVLPQLGAWTARSRRHPGSVAMLTTVDAAALLEHVGDIRRAGIELLAPERLVRRRPSVKGTARPDDSTGGLTARPTSFGPAALIDWRVVIDGAVVDEAALLRAAELGAGLLNVGARWVIVEQAEARRALAALAKHRANHSAVTPLDLVRLAASLVAEPRQADDESSDDIDGRGWAEQLLSSLPDLVASDGIVPDGFTATLRPYQRRGLGWLQSLAALGLGGCLADDMGLGKTPTTLAHLAAIPGPHLVVCPLSVVRNWENEAARFVPGQRVLVHHGAQRAEANDLASRVADADIVVTTYQVATRDIEALGSVQWQVVVLDEAQMVKNPDTRSARAMRTLPAQQRVALTGTPVENRLRELWSIFQITVPGLLGGAKDFGERFATPIERHRDAKATLELRRLTGPFLLRRTKADRSLVPDLPDKVEQIAWSALTREQATMYQAVVNSLLDEVKGAGGMQRRGLVLAALTRLKQICNHPAHALGDGSKLAGRSGKLHRFDELVTDFLDTGERALVFTQFVEMGELLQQHLRERFHVDAPFLHGGVPRLGRDRMVTAFQSDPQSSPLLLVSLRAGGVGLNLTAASRVVHFDRWWNPAVEDQATDRAWRIGQQQAVFVHKLVCEGTVEERIDALINDKRSLAKAVVGTDGENWLTELDDDALRALLALDTSKVRPA